MSHTSVGMFLGAILAAISLAWGIQGFLLGVLFIVIGAILGRAASGKLDLRGVGQALIGRSSTDSD